VKEPAPKLFQEDKIPINPLCCEKVEMAKILVTGGAGFIGSHLVDRLMEEGHSVLVVDNLSSGDLSFISQWLNDKDFKFIKGDITDASNLSRVFEEKVDVVFHLAANPEVRLGDPRVHFHQNLYATYLILESMRRHRVKEIIFASSSTVYGETSVLPTPENYAPLKPISVYGSAKLAAEALISGYSHTFKIRGTSLRLANIIGPRSRHGVIFDFIQKLKKNPSRLEVLGDGTQTKSYLYIDDYIEAFIKIFHLDEKPLYDVYNVGSTDQVNVMKIAEIVVKAMGLDTSNVEIYCTGGVEGGRGWIGDVKVMLLDVRKLLSTGWKPRYTSEEAVRLTAEHLRGELEG